VRQEGKVEVSAQQQEKATERKETARQGGQGRRRMGNGMGTVPPVGWVANHAEMSA